jgi:hypothetical protein
VIRARHPRAKVFASFSKKKRFLTGAFSLARCGAGEQEGGFPGVAREAGGGFEIGARFGQPAAAE